MKQRYKAFVLLSPDDQARARERFSPAGRRFGWEHIGRWAFQVGKRGALVKGEYIEPAYTLSGAKIPEVWEG